MEINSVWALFLFETLQLGNFAIQAGFRYERKDFSPDDLQNVEVRISRERILVKEVNARQFDIISGSIAGLWSPTSALSLGVNIARSSRAPNLQELYSDGPHLADFSYDIGTPDLPTEVGWGTDIFMLLASSSLNLEVAAFVNHIDNYIQYNPTLETVRVFREGSRPRSTPVFEATNQDVLFIGLEGEANIPLIWGFHLEGALSYVQAEERATANPVAFIPPLHGHATLRYKLGSIFTTFTITAAAEQSRIPDPIPIRDTFERPQQPTNGYTLFGASIGWLPSWGNTDHTLILRAFNLGDAVWRDHLSRIKDVAPQTGRNISLTYQLSY